MNESRAGAEELWNEAIADSDLRRDAAGGQATGAVIDDLAKRRR